MSKQRENRIDLLRGLSLLLIFIGHAEFTFSLAFQHSRGFCDASEMFVLLSGMSAALAYYRPGATLMVERPWKRAWRLYLVHLLLFAVMAAVAAVALGYFQAAAKAIDMVDFWKDPLWHGLEALALSFMPGNLDILPLYVVLLLLAPCIFVLHDRSIAVLLALSGAVWLAAGMGHINFVNLALEGHIWYFDPLSWQFIFVIGICLGIRVKLGQPVLPYNGPLFAAAAVFAFAAIPANMAIYFDIIDSPFGNLHHELVSKTNGGPLRIINVLAILYLAWNIPAVKKMADHPSMQLLCTAGRHSLPIFSVGVLLSFCALVMMRVDPQTPLSVQLLVMTTGCLLQLALAYCLERRKTARASSGGTRDTAPAMAKLSPAE